MRDWADAEPCYEVTAFVEAVAEYEPGAFYKRELPCLLAVLAKLPAVPDLVVVDGYAWLGPERPGLGAHLYEALKRAVPVAGVAKTRFRSADEVATAVTRAGSKQPLWVTAVGVDAAEAAECVRRMHGEYRVPTLLNRVDRLCRDGPAETDS